MKNLKKLWLNICGGCDFLVSRAAKPSTWVIGGGTGIACGALLGVGVAALEQDSNDKLDDIREDYQAWKADNAKFDTQVFAIDPANVCGIDEGWYFAGKEKNGDYALYKGEKGNYYPQDKDFAEDFAEDLRDCFTALRALDEQQANFEIDFNVVASQALRSDNTLEEGDTVIRYLKDYHSYFDGTLQRLVNEFGEDAAFEKLESVWGDALDAFEDGDAFEAADYQGIPTYEYTYQAAEFPLAPIFHFAVIGLFAGGIGAGFSKTPSADYKDRAEKRDERRRALDAKPLDF